MSIEDRLLRPSDNNFTLVRLCLAISVIYSHSYWAVFGVPSKDDLSQILGDSVSDYAVNGFFVLSGFLVYPSLLRLGQVKRFLLARLTRLWPGLVCSIVLTALAGLTVTSAALTSYFRGDTLKFLVGNLTFLKGYYTLTGVACGGRACIVNGSLWTLPWEARCYLGLALLGAVGLARPKAMVWLVLPATLVGALAWDFGAVRTVFAAHAGPNAVWAVGIAQRLWPLFVLGAGAYILRRRIVLSWWILGALFALALATNELAFSLQIRSLLIGYGVLCAGLLTAKKGALSGKWPDYSYGVYIYAFPVMIALHALWPTHLHLVLAAATLAATLPLAALSWHLIERPALDAFRRRNRERTATAAPPPLAALSSDLVALDRSEEVAQRE
jgi:peptidoglycan/LPS O-acetylase OafA/YrhL